MSLAQAREVRDKGWLALVLALVGGWVDAVGYLVLFNMFTAHMSGNSIAMTVRIGQGRWGEAFHRAFPIPSFVAGVVVGSAVSQLLIRRGWRSTFAAALGLEAVLLLVFIGWGGAELRAGGIDLDPAWRFYLLAALPALAMGIQNAALRRVGGVGVGTTYITGMLTDCAEDAVQYLFWLGDRVRSRRRPVRLRLLLRLSARQASFNGMLLRFGIWLGYVAGGITGAVAQLGWGLLPLAAPVFALACIAGCDLARPIYPPRSGVLPPDRKGGGPPPLPAGGPGVPPGAGRDARPTGPAPIS